ncbi:hypothetical protein Q3G72_008600 [Acer saccharum]|nr:hypothetical protein Q3G72_008600 [Acer saccharum]
MLEMKVQPTVQTFGYLAYGYCSLEMYCDITILWGDIKRNTESGILLLSRDLYEFILLNFLRGGYFEKVMEVIGYMKENSMYTDKWMYKSEFLKHHKNLYTSLKASNVRTEAQSKRLEYVRAFRKWAVEEEFEGEEGDEEVYEGFLFVLYKPMPGCLVLSKVSITHAGIYQKVDIDVVDEISNEAASTDFVGAAAAARFVTVVLFTYISLNSLQFPAFVLFLLAISNTSTLNGQKHEPHMAMKMARRKPWSETLSNNSSPIDFSRCRRLLLLPSTSSADPKCCHLSTGRHNSFFVGGHLQFVSTWRTKIQLLQQRREGKMKVLVRVAH